MIDNNINSIGIAVNKAILTTPVIVIYIFPEARACGYLILRFFQGLGG
jgi:hypothetical protein